jgi:putative effector of murein hydrolase
MIDTVTAFSILVTLGAYAGSRVVGRRYPSPLTTPVFLSTIVVILILVPARVGVTDYEHAKQIMIFLLGPATVGLAVPLYQKRAMLTSNLLPALVGLTLGSLTTFVSALGLAALFGLPDVMRASISVKSVTAPVAIALAPIIDGSPTLTATFAVATGMIGAVLGPSLMTVIGIHDPLARGLALGTISHGQGTAQAVLEGELQGATAGVAMGLAAAFVSAIAPVLIPFLK